MRPARRANRSTRSAAEDERGAGLVSTLTGLAIFLSLMLFAAQLLVSLYARSVVTSAAFDAARLVAGADADRDGNGMPDEGSVVAAEAHARTLLGRYGRDDVTFDWAIDGDRVALRVRAPAPTILRSVSERLPFSQIDRTVRVRLERFRDD